jgi:hypothetical protein
MEKMDRDKGEERGQRKKKKAEEGQRDCNE